MIGQVNKPNIPGIISEAKRFERERILKELQDHPYRLQNGMFCECGSPVNYWIHIQSIVKGENK